MTKRQQSRPARLYDSLSSCQKEEEVKAEFCKFFKMKLCALGRSGHYTEGVLFEFKHDWNFRRPDNVAMEFLNPDVEYFT